MCAPPNAAAAAATQPPSGRGLFDAVKRARTADALRYAGARLSTVGRRVVPSGRRIRLGDAVRLDDDARRFLSSERRSTHETPRFGGPLSCQHSPDGRPDPACLGGCGRTIQAVARQTHWSEAPAW